MKYTQGFKTDDANTFYPGENTMESNTFYPGENTMENNGEQRRATTMVPSLRQLTYEERLASLRIMPLEKRGIREDLIETFKVLKQMDKVDPSFFFSKATSRYATRGHPMKLFKPALNKNLNCRKQFFTMRVINHWNGLPTLML